MGIRSIPRRVYGMFRRTRKERSRKTNFSFSPHYESRQSLFFPKTSFFDEKPYTAKVGGSEIDFV